MAHNTTTTFTHHTTAITPQQPHPKYPPTPLPQQQRHQRPQTSYFSSFMRWLQLKKYQYEVTFSLYMLTPTERLIFNVIILLLLILLVAAASMYLPNHVALIYNRIWYYVHGNSSDSAVDHADTLMREGAKASAGVKDGVQSLGMLAGSTRIKMPVVSMSMAQGWSGVRRANCEAEG